jgi:hypothetical protein
MAPEIRTNRFDGTTLVIRIPMRLQPPRPQADRYAGGRAGPGTEAHAR